MIIVFLLQVIFHMDPKQMFPWLTLLILDGTCVIPEATVPTYRHLMQTDLKIRYAQRQTSCSVVEILGTLVPS